MITLAIIGVVAAITMPVLIQKHRNHVVETKLKRFYSNINQAITLAEVEHGDRRQWGFLDIDDAWDNYLSKYLNYMKVEEAENDWGGKDKIIYFADGSAIDIDGFRSGCYAHIYYYTNAKYLLERKGGVNCFLFLIGTTQTGVFKYHYNKGVEPYKVHWDGTENQLYNAYDYGCKADNPELRRQYCAALIQYNGWKIPKDYPFKVR